MEINPFLSTQADNFINSIADCELMEEHGFDQMVRLLREENLRPFADERCEEGFMAIGGGVLGDEDFCSSAVEQVLGFYSVGTCGVDPCVRGPSVSRDAEGGVEEKDEDGDSSGTITATRPRSGRDRARTLVTERKRRGRMKEKLYELRSLVPNITKMDKASIIEDAITYIKDLQKQAKILTEEITTLEASPKAQTFPSPLQDLKPSRAQDMKSPLEKREILAFTACEVGDQRFYLRVECSKGEGTPAALYRAMEALAFIHLESSTFSTLSQRHEVNFALKVRGRIREMNASMLRLWVMTALANEGFEFKTSSQ